MCLMESAAIAAAAAFDGEALLPAVAPRLVHVHPCGLRHTSEQPLWCHSQCYSLVAPVARPLMSVVP